MKKLFNHTKRPYEKWNEKDYIEENDDWDVENVYESEDGEYYADGEYETEEGEYYADGEYETEEGEYYADGEYETEDGEYETEEGEYYADGEYEPESGEYYADGEDESEDGERYADGGYYAEESYESEDDSYYAEEEEYDEEKAGGIAAFWEKIFNMGAMDRIMAATGICVLILALITGGVYASARMVDNQATDFISVGAQLEGIKLPGEKGLMAVADAQLARLEAAEIVEEEKFPQYNENAYNNVTSVKLDMVSIQKDLKIKFTNRETDKLISNVPFAVTVTDPNGGTATWNDDDMDGIIYKKGITPGKYKITVNALEDQKYKNYIMPSAAETVQVKAEIVYEKVDVKNEIKNESQVNASQEDTKKNETVVESVLENTVQWVESTVTSNTYVEISKSKIPDPLTLVSRSRFMRTASHTATISNSSLTLAPGGSATLSATVKNLEGTEVEPDSITWMSTNSEVATVDEDGKVTAVTVGEAIISFSAKVTVKDVSGNDTSTIESITGQCTVKVEGKIAITLEETAVTVYLKEPVTIKATIENALTDADVTAESDDEDVATVKVDGRKITIKGKEEGSTTIIVRYKENGAEVKATCAVTVKSHPKYDDETKLKDEDGRQLYVLDDDKYREAVYADYYTEDKFFLRGDAKYTGWQTFDGKVYFYDASGKKVTGEQVIQGAKYSFASDGSLVTGDGVMGIDVSKWNGSIDWKAVKNSGVSYVIIRCGYRGSSKGSLIEDPKYQNNIKGAINAGLKVGVYFFTQAIDEVEAVEEASMVLELIKGHKISYPIFLDVEPSGGRADGLSKSQRTAVCKAFCETIQDAGYTAGIYANKTWLNEKMDVSQLSAYKIWLAQYAATPTYKGRYDLWQYSKSGRISGISGDVDLNISYLGY